MSVLRSKDDTMRLVVVLGVTGVLAGALLAAIYGWINPIIEERRLEEVMSVGLMGIFPEAKSFSEVTLENVPKGVEEPVYKVLGASGEELGIWFAGSAPGYGGPIKMAIGANTKDASLVGVRVLEQTETPGLGSEVVKDGFLAQLSGKRLSDAFKIGSDVTGVSGATVSSRAVFNGAAEMGRAVLAELGIDVEVTEQASANNTQSNASASQSAGQGEPSYVAQIKEILEGDLKFKPAVWEIAGTDDKVSVAVENTVQGYMGPISVVTVIDPSANSILGLRVTNQGETPGLGARITDDEAFLAQFVGKQAENLVVGNGIDAITMATVSSSAVAEAARRALQTVEQLY